MVVFSHLVVSDSLQPHGLYVAHQAPLSMGFLRQEYWSGLLFPSPGDLPDSRIEPTSPALQTDSLPLSRTVLGNVKMSAVACLETIKEVSSQGFVHVHFQVYSSRED